MRNLKIAASALAACLVLSSTIAASAAVFPSVRGAGHSHTSKSATLSTGHGHNLGKVKTR